MITTDTRVVDAALAPGRLVPAYQPIVDLESGEVVGYEALARWPQDDGLDPGVVFAAAAESGRVPEVEWACRSAAITHALDAELPSDLSLFVNVEPATLGQAPPSSYERVIDLAQDRLRVVLELTERALLRDPAHVLHMVSWARDRGLGHRDGRRRRRARVAALPALRGPGGHQARPHADPAHARRG